MRFVRGCPFAASSASRPMKPPLSSFTAKPSPASQGVTSGVSLAAPGAIALLDPQRLDRVVAGVGEAEIARRAACSAS